MSPVYDVTVEVDGVVYIAVEAENADDACRRARHLVERGEGVPHLDYEAVEAREAEPV